MPKPVAMTRARFESRVTFMLGSMSLMHARLAQAGVVPVLRAGGSNDFVFAWWCDGCGCAVEDSVPCPDPPDEEGLGPDQAHYDACLTENVLHVVANHADWHRGITTLNDALRAVPADAPTTGLVPQTVGWGPEPPVGAESWCNVCGKVVPGTDTCNTCGNEELVPNRQPYVGTYSERDIEAWKSLPTTTQAGD